VSNLGFRAWPPAARCCFIRVMSGSVGVARGRAPVAADGAPGPISRLRRRSTEALSREPFVVLVLALDALILTTLLPFVVGSDTWLALVGGRRVDQGWLPHHDTLTIWSHGATWIDQQWLGQLLFYWIHAAGGFRLLLMVHVAVLLGAYVLALAFAFRSGASSRSVAVVGAVGLLVALPSSAARTQAYALPLFVLLFRLLASEWKAPTRRVLLALPLLVLWANIHGSVVLGVGLVWAWAVAQILRAGRRAGAGRVRAGSVGLALASVLCLFASPYGPAVAGYYHDILGAQAFRDFVTEWAPTTFPSEWSFFLLLLGALWLTARQPKTLSLFEHLALLGTAVAALEAIRNIVWFALVVIMVVPRALDGVWRIAPAPLRPRVNRALSIGALVVIAGGFVAATARPSSWYTRSYPPGALETVAATTARDPSLRVFANERYADWLLWKLPRLSGRVAFDARFELLSPEQLRSVNRFRTRFDPSLAAADGYGLLVLESGDEKTAIRLLRRQQGVRQLYRDSHVTVLLRTRRAQGS
jgi:hypothetical protein